MLSAEKQKSAFVSNILLIKKYYQQKIFANRNLDFTQNCYNNLTNFQLGTN